MTEKEAKRQIKEHLDIAGCEDLMCETEALEMAMSALEEIQVYRAIGTVEEFKALKEKAEPKKPDYQNRERAKCPLCGSFGVVNYCMNCGTKLDWS